MDKKELIEEIKKLESRKSYGLVWEDKPEDVVEQCKTQIPIVSEDETKGIEKDLENPTNLVIEGDNYHALSVLNYTHKKKVDVIYIDPPYNTGAKDWRYNNDYVDREDTFRHSKWISMMSNRIRLAKCLLSETGFIICAIDEYEIHNLRHILDDIFGRENYLGMVTVVHNPKGRNLSKFFSANSEFMIVYALNVNKAEFNDVVIDDSLKETFDLSDDTGSYRLEPFMRARTVWSRQNRPKNWYPIYVSKDLKHITHKKNNDYHEVFPITNSGKEMSWKNIKSSFVKLNKDGYFVAKENGGRITIYHKYREKQVFKNVWTDKKYQSEFHGTNLLKKILGEKIFDYPKSLYLVSDILKLTTKNDSTILDFFAGSGTTGHAVLELNKEDGGNRKFILCTNNENNIAEEVTYPRVKNVIEGYGDEEGIPANLRYYKTDFVDVESVHNVSDQKKIELTYKAGRMIALREDTLEEVEKNDWWQIFTDKKGRMTAIYFKEDKEKIDKLIAKISKADTAALYIFSWGKNEYKNEYTEYKNIRVEDIPEPILEVYKEINKK